MNSNPTTRAAAGQTGFGWGGRPGIVASTTAAVLLSLLGPAIVALLFASSSSSSSSLRPRASTARDDGDTGAESSSGGRGTNVGDPPVDVVDNRDGVGRGEAAGARLVVVPFFYSPPPPRNDDDDDYRASTNNDGGNDHENEPPFRDLMRALKGYETDARSALNTLSRAEAVARESERVLFGGGDRGGPIAAGIRERRGRLAEVLEADGFVLQDLLRPFPVVRALPSGGGGGADATYCGRRYEEGVEVTQSTEDEGPGEGGRGCEDRGGRKGPANGDDEFVLKYRSSPFHQAAGGGGVDDGSETHADYDSAASVLSHVARDWSVIGRSARSSTYDWCISRLESYLPVLPRGYTSTTSVEDGREGSGPVRVLVPGAGLARLARDVALAGYVVEANDRSVVMAAAAHAILHHGGGADAEGGVGGMGRGVIHPHAMESFSNEVDPDLRFEAVGFPDDDDECFVGGGASDGRTMGRDDSPSSCRHPGHPRSPKSRHPDIGSMSYTVGDFVSTYATTERRGTFDSLVTCFFLDTASNLFEYVAVIRNLLRRRGSAASTLDGGEDNTSESSPSRRVGGLWINVGPLQWHRDAVIRPSVDELRSFLESTGDFDVLEWSVDDEVVPYGHEGETGLSGRGGGGGEGGGSKPRSTRFEGYRPLRFVVALRDNPGEGGGCRAGMRGDDAMGDVLAVRRAIDTMTTFGGGSGGRRRTSNSGDRRGGRCDDAEWGGRRERGRRDASGMTTMEEAIDTQPPKSSLLGGLPRIEVLEDDEEDEKEEVDDDGSLDRDYDVIDDADLIIPEVD